MNTITTFDGKFWNKQELLTKMNDDDFYFNYLGKNVLSSSSCSYLLNSPKNYKDKLVAEFNKPSPQQRIGSLVHYRILEPEKWDKIHFVDTKSVANKIYKEALNTHKLVYLKQEKDLAEELAYSILDISKCLAMLRNARTEVPAISEIFDLPFRGKADILGADYIVDLKTHTGDLKKFRWKADDFNYDMQMYIYCTLFDISYKNFTFLVMDKQSKSIGVFEISKEFYNSGRRKTLDAVNIYKQYFIEKKRKVEEFYLYDVL